MSNSQTYIDVRRQKVLAFLVKGLTHKQISNELEVNVKTIQRDIKWLKTNKRIDIELIRTFNWDEIMRLLPGLTKLQQARLRIDIQRILEPKQIKQQIEATGDLRFILEAWRPDTEEENEKDEE